MKILNSDLSKAFEIAKQYLNFKNSDYIIKTEEKNIDGYQLTINENEILISFKDKNFFFEALADIEANVFKSRKHSFKKFGMMLDCARNGVVSVDNLKRLIVISACLGISYIGLYLEDCLEVIDEPYFGYMRGRMTQSEIKDIVAFADNFGIEIIPYIQTLAHLGRLFNNWDPYDKDMHDIDDIILAEDPRTMQLIENILKTVSICFKSKRIHIGMDEAYHMFLGKYRDIHGDQDRTEVFQRHVFNVCELCAKYNLEPIAWADMFVKFSDSGRLKVPDNLTLNYWDYYRFDSKEYLNRYKEVAKVCNKVVFGGGLWSWTGFTPNNTTSEMTSIAAMKGLKGKVDDFCFTIWGDDGRECAFSSVLGPLIKLMNYASDNKLSSKELDEKSILLTGYKVKELYALELPNKVFDCKAKDFTNTSKIVFYYDPFHGLSDREENPVWIPYFAKAKRTLSRLAKKNSYYNYLFKTMADLAAVCELKCCLFKDIREAYSKQDKEALKIIIERIKLVIKKVNIFYQDMENQWLKECNPFGFEVQSIRIGGLMERLKYINKRLTKFVNGEIKSIYELEQPVHIIPNPKNQYNGATCFNMYKFEATYSLI